MTGQLTALKNTCMHGRTEEWLLRIVQFCGPMEECWWQPALDARECGATKHVLLEGLLWKLPRVCQRLTHLGANVESIWARCV